MGIYHTTSCQLLNAADLCGRHGGYGMGLDNRQISWYTLFIKSFTASAVIGRGLVNSTLVGTRQNRGTQGRFYEPLAQQD